MLEKTLESPLDCNQSILKEFSPKYSLEGLMLKLKLQYFGHLMWRTDSLEKTLMLGKIECRRRRRRQRMWWLDDITMDYQLNGHEFEQAPGDSKEQGSLAYCSPWGHKESVTTEWLNWTELILKWTYISSSMKFLTSTRVKSMKPFYVIFFNIRGF